MEICQAPIRKGERALKTTIKITNRSRYCDREVKRLLRFAYQSIIAVWNLPTKEIRIKVTNTKKAWGGYGFIGAYGSDSEGFHVCIRIGRPEHFHSPRRASYDYKWREMPAMMLKEYREAIIYVAAHEFAHVAGKSGRKGGEMHCDFAGQDAVDEWRRLEYESPACLI